MPRTTTTGLPNPVQNWFNHTLLAVATPEYIHRLGCVRYTIPRNNSKTITFRRPNRLPTALVPLGNQGIDPPSTPLTAVDISATVDWYGQWVEINEQVTLTSQDPVLNWAAERLGQSMLETSDQLVKNMLEATASQINAVNGINGDNPTEISLPDVSDVINVLMSADAKRMLDNIEGQNRFGTAPIANAFMALAHTDLSSDLRNVQGFIHVSQYPSQGPVMRSEWGSVENVRFFLSSIGSKIPNASSLGNDVYNVFIQGMESVACIDLDGANAQFIFNSPEVVGGPLRQNASAAWKMAEVSRIVNDTWLVALRVTRG